MRFFLALFLISACTVPAFCQPESVMIRKAGELIEQKKYDSAFNLLNRYDPGNGKPDIVLLKEDIVLNFFVTSIMHKVFALKDLEKGQDVMDYRGKEGVYNMHYFDPETVLDSLITLYPGNCKLYKGLGNYYYEVFLHYGGKWQKSDEELFRLIALNDNKAVEEHCEDYMTCYVLGYISLSKKDYPAAIPWFQKSIAMNSHYANSFYNLAYACLLTDDLENAEKNAKRALALYADKEYKGDAARMLGQIYSERKDDRNAIENYELSEKIDPGNYYTLRPLLYFYVKTANPGTKELTRRFFELDEANPTIYNDLEDIYYSNNKEKELLAFYQEQLDVVIKDPRVLGSLHFYIGKIYLGTDNALARDHLVQARELFLKVYDKDHKVFQAIDQGLKQAGQ